MKLRALRSVACTVALFVLVSGPACVPLPIPHTEQVTPSVVGVLRRSDGSPVAGERVASTAVSEDRHCQGTGARATTDSNGTFQLPATQVRRRILWVTMMESFGLTPYWVCAGSADSSTTSRGTQHGGRIFVLGHRWGDSLSLVSWIWHDTMQVTFDRQIATGGGWSEGGATGFYRVLVAATDNWGHAARAYVEWVERTPAGAQKVRAIAELEAGAPIVGAEIDEARGHWFAIVQRARPPKGSDLRRLMFELGPPGVVRPATDR
jgi:hypothetical protein